MNVKCWLAVFFALEAALAFAANPAPRREQVTPDPNDPEKTRPMISREEREELGLAARKWTGVVDQEVYATLGRLNKVVASLKEREKKKDVAALQARWRIRFPGTVYVELHLKDKAAQSRVLASLKASEFHVVHLFEKHPGLTGNASREAIDSLAKHPDVVGITLDNKPLPKRPKPIVKEDLPPARPGEAATEPGVAERKVEADVYRAFALSDYVEVMVNLRGNTIVEPTDVSSQMLAREEVREQQARKLQDEVLSTINANEFWLKMRIRGGPTISGLINRAGLEKLWKHPDVVAIGLMGLERPAVMRNR